MNMCRKVLAGFFVAWAAWAAAAWAAVEYVDPTDGGTVKSCEAYEGAGAASWKSGKWYVAEGSAIVPERIQVSGNVNLILCDGAVLSATNGGIRVANGASLTVWGQRAGSGMLKATGSASCAGIGGNDGESGGTVVVYGGKVEAKGGEYGAGIGGGDSGAGGVVEVHGGEVWAGGNDGSAGIGGGDYGNGGSFTITGGKVTALGGARKAGGKATGQAAAGIGAGRPEIDRTEGTVVSGGHRSSGTVSILGGEVTAKAGVPPASVQNMEYYHPDPAQAIGVNVQDAKSNGTNYLSLGTVAVYTSADAAEPVAAAERGAACRGTNVWTRPCTHGTGLTCPWCGRGAGTRADPYLIGSYAALVEFAGKVNGGQNDACGVLTADIAAEGTDWVAIGNKDPHSYIGTFDGAGYTISGLRNEETPYYAGLFGVVVSGGVVRNVRLEGVAFNGEYVGGVAGENNGTVSNCCVSGRVQGTKDVGGVVGYNWNTVADCHSACMVSGRDATGGVVGWNQVGTVANCHNTGAVSGKPGGGVVGVNHDSGTVANSYCPSSLGVEAIRANQGTVEGECKVLTEEEYTVAGSFKGWDFGTVWEMGTKGPVLRNLVLPGDGTEWNPYRIGDYEGLMAFARRVNVERQTGAWGVLTADIAAEGTDWVAIGTMENRYKGTFDGAGHVIAGLRNEETPTYAGLFGVVHSDGVVRNVRLERVVFNGSTAGGVVENNSGTVSNCCVSGRVWGQSPVGGVVACNDGTVANCHNSATVSGGEYAQVGGVVGFNNSGGTVRNCHNTGAVSVSGGEYAQVGGVVGYNNSGGTVANCHNSATVSGGEDAQVGGVVGFNNGLSTVANSYCLAGVGAAEIGWNNGGTVEECAVLSATAYTNEASFQGWDFGNVWVMGPEGPWLRVFGESPLYGEEVDGVKWLYRLVLGEVTVARVAGAVPAEGSLVVPGTLGGVSVTGVGAGAFAGCEELTGLRLPEGVGSVGAGAFAGCTGLKELWVPIARKGSGLLDGAGVPEGCEVRYYGTQKVRFEGNGGQAGAAEGEYAIGERYGWLPEASWEGHRWVGWFDKQAGGSAVTADSVVSEEAERTLWARWGAVRYVSGDGDDTHDGSSREKAKRQIWAALEGIGEKGTVHVGAGTYGAFAAPEGAWVFGEAGGGACVVDGGGAGRCVEVAAGAVVEGVTLTGGRAQGDGGGALLADGAALRRCILRGNEATGAGGGASGGVLENCLVVSNRAGAGGGGAAGSVLRHCTVAGNAGGGVKDCTVENGIVWGNAGGAQAEGGSVSWSLCEGASGPGCVEGEPGFMDAAGGNWRLAYGSRCVDAAAESGVALDLDGSPRPQPKVYGEVAKADMGCYEYVPKARFVWKEGNAVPPYESWADAAHEIQSALDVSADGDLVVVEAGTYGAFAASNAVTLTGLRGAERTFIDAEGAGRGATMAAGGVLEGFTVRNGDAGDGAGGGIWAGGGAVVRDVTVENCRAERGGGIYAAGTGTVERCVLRGNTASSGGGAWIEDGSRMTGCEIADNEAASAGGALVQSSELAECQVRDNRATGGLGGGVVAISATLRNNVVTGNSAPNQGGGMGLTGSFAHDCIVAGNRAAEGAGVWMMGGETWNFTVADNLGDGAGVALFNLGDMTGVFANGITWNNAGGNLVAAEGTVAKNVCTDRDPLFAGEGDYHLRAGSPCIDAGETADWMADACDMDGQRRVEPVDGIGGRDTHVDIGADEAAVDAVEGPSAGGGGWTWRVVPDARLQLQSTTNLLDPASWKDDGAAFEATNGVWRLSAPLSGTGTKFLRLIWRKE